MRERVRELSLTGILLSTIICLYGTHVSAGDAKACVECETENVLWSVPVALKGAIVSITFSNTGKPLTATPPPDKYGCGVQLFNNPGPAVGTVVKVSQQVGGVIGAGQSGGGAVCLEGGGNISADCDDIGDECKFEYSVDVIATGKCKHPWSKGANRD